MIERCFELADEARFDPCIQRREAELVVLSMGSKQGLYTWGIGGPNEIPITLVDIVQQPKE
ncbi:MAG: hypothetical protein E5Y00_01080 [Mesorhizobium sp.]|nr:MAG: hypothetical protein E5Y00_01080 [Mesorhizobium sp.]